MRQLVICDYDRTLFDSGRYERALPPVLHDAFGIDAVTFGAEIPQRTGTGGYDLFAHLEDHGVRADAAYHAITAALGGTPFLFSDTPHFLRHISVLPGTDLVVVTTGSTRYQELKLEYLKRAAPHIPTHIVGINKGNWLENTWIRHELHPLGRHIEFQGQAYHHVVVIDDKVSPLEAITPSPHILLIHVLRPGARYQNVIDGPDVTQDLLGAASLISIWAASQATHT